MSDDLRWHSVAKEGYPPNDKIVLITYDYGKDGKSVESDHRRHDGTWQEWYDNDWEDVVFSEPIIAWMPYPEPYDGE